MASWRRGVFLPGVVVGLPTLTEKDIDDIVNWGIKHDIDLIAASFVRKASNVQYIRKILADNGGSGIKTSLMFLAQKFMLREANIGASEMHRAWVIL